jgi:hypothetical protein
MYYHSEMDWSMKMSKVDMFAIFWVGLDDMIWAITGWFRGYVY